MKSKFLSLIALLSVAGVLWASLSFIPHVLRLPYDTRLQNGPPPITGEVLGAIRKSGWESCFLAVISISVFYGVQKSVAACPLLKWSFVILSAPLLTFLPWGLGPFALAWFLAWKTERKVQK
jgi:hypothetical protein